MGLEQRDRRWMYGKGQNLGISRKDDIEIGIRGLMIGCDGCEALKSRIPRVVRSFEGLVCLDDSVID